MVCKMIWHMILEIGQKGLVDARFNAWPCVHLILDLCLVGIEINARACTQLVKNKLDLKLPHFYAQTITKKVMVLCPNYSSIS